MRVGIDITPLQVAVSGGIGMATYRTLLALANLGGLELTLYGTGHPFVPFSGEPLNLDLPMRMGGGPLARSNVAWLQYGVGPLLKADDTEVFWGTRQVVPRRTGGAATVVTLHDLWHARDPEQQPFVYRTVNRHVIESSISRADLIVTVSAATGAEARRIYGTPPERLRVVHHGVDASLYAPASTEAERAADEAVLGALAVRRPYVLAMDAYNPRKNIRAVFDAIAQLGEEAGDLHVVVLGAPRKTATELDVPALAVALGVRERVLLPGDVTPYELRALYRGAHAFVYPSLYEGFGMPVLESMSCGTPVITSTTSSLPEVAGTAAILVEPTDAHALAHALRAILTDGELRARLCAEGVARAAGFTWERTAEDMRQVFCDAVEIGRRSHR